ncbi:hypothetical protein DPMN_147671 [Dreissena polymorpha]|uniref:Uncharacterized protein n=2 Tax=Dreissena polymorpha TaxID=45954 RepID=A0A9D4F8A9_DREPO|nr:hypothetical protein DPMN_147671 [Dreissena polymorpha]
MACAVNPNGDRIYLTNEEYNLLVTIASDGTLISEKNIHVLKRNLELAQPVPSGLHVTDNGQILVCGGMSDPNAIVRVNDNGKYLATLATVVTGEDGVKSPASACYRNQYGALIVGMWNNDSIMVFTQESITPNLCGSSLKYTWANVHKAC